MLDEEATLAAEFEAHRAHLLGLGYRMLGSVSEAEDVVQEAWLRFRRADRAAIREPRAFLSRVVARLCLDARRGRGARPTSAPGCPIPCWSLGPSRPPGRRASSPPTSRRG